LKAIDTNVLARFVMQDDPAQSDAATKMLAQSCFVSDTVLLEPAWLLSSRFGMLRQKLAATLLDLVLLPSLSVSDEKLVLWAIDRFAKGADFADMMHIVSSRYANSFVSFETKLATLAGPDAPIAIETLA